MSGRILLQVPPVNGGMLNPAGGRFTTRWGGIRWDMPGQAPRATGPDPEVVPVSAPLTRAVLYAERAGLTDTVVTILRDGVEVGSARLAAGATGQATALAIPWTPTAAVTFTVAAGGDVSGLAVELYWG